MPRLQRPERQRHSEDTGFCFFFFGREALLIADVIGAPPPAPRSSVTTPVHSEEEMKQRAQMCSQQVEELAFKPVPVQFLSPCPQPSPARPLGLGTGARPAATKKSPQLVALSPERKEEGTERAEAQSSPNPQASSARPACSPAGELPNPLAWPSRQRQSAADPPTSGT